MPRPINLLLVRHAVSQANLDRSLYQRLPDPRVPLAPQGHAQAKATGAAIAAWLKAQSDPGGTRIYCSPYQRTRETSEHIEAALREHDIAFDRIEELALREMTFGLFDGIADEELPQLFPREHAHYQKHVDFEGEFYAPMPLGESRVQVADRVKGVFGTIIRDNRERENGWRIKNFIIVSHGVTIRAFIMQWLHLTPEWYQAQANPANASVTMISSDGVEPYRTSMVFEGFPHRPSKQDIREEGTVQAAPDANVPAPAG
jgi:2,3-bisphosphoglycerate-dependent phosphoglycerate mutase